MDTPPREQTPRPRVCRCTRSGCTPAKRTLLEISPAKCTPKMEGGSVLFRNTATHLPKYPPTYLTRGSLNTEHLGTTEHSRNSNRGKLSHSWAPFYLTTFINCGSDCIEHNSWQANRYLHLSHNPTFRYRVHMTPTTDPIQSQMSLAHLTLTPLSFRPGTHYRHVTWAYVMPEVWRARARAHTHTHTHTHTRARARISSCHRISFELDYMQLTEFSVRK